MLRELRDIVEAADERPVKALLELADEREEEKIAACELALDSGVRFLGAGTGFHGPVASVEEVIWLRERLAGQIAIEGGRRNPGRAGGPGIDRGGSGADRHGGNETGGA